MFDKFNAVIYVGPDYEPVNAEISIGELSHIHGFVLFRAVGESSAGVRVFGRCDTVADGRGQWVCRVMDPHGWVPIRDAHHTFRSMCSEGNLIARLLRDVDED